MADEPMVAPKVTRGAPAPIEAPKRTIEAWKAEKPIANYAPGTPNHAALMAGVHAHLGKVQGLELTEAAFDQAVEEFLGIPIGYRVLGSGKAG